ncbi:hypothetical protein M9434_004193 [Picochlorum sp. BPE23]|nr:hypothetical protein M9434_004193 [Picochlorum sp. BPE23]
MDEFDRLQNESKLSCVPGMDLFLCNHQPSISAVLRDVKKREHGLFNCVASIMHDSLFVREIAEETGLPVFGNLRCGAWYTSAQDMDGTCYFKSTDGHTGQWSFSLTRLNLHVAEKAVACGGCIIVDATRRGKRYPDALSKTVPVWAHVLNTAVLQYQREHDMPCMAESDLCLPDWVSEHEQWQIEQRVDGWCQGLLQSGVDMSGLASEMRKPLMCCWIDQGRRNVPEGGPMIVLVSASKYGVRERLSLPHYTNIVYDYIPGAGDDEESWACGLTPDIFWKHHDVILNTDPADVVHLVKTLIQENTQSVMAQSDPGVLWVPKTNMGMVSLAYFTRQTEAFCSNDTMAVVNLSGHDLTAMIGEESMETCPCTSISGGGMLSKDNQIVQLVVDERSESTGSIARHLWLPRVLGKHRVVCASPAVVEFASRHLAHGKSVLFVYDHTQSWCGPLAAALILTTLVACFSFSQDGDDAWVLAADYSIDTQGARLYPAVEQISKDGLSRNTFKRYVAKSVGQYLPHIVIRKDILKQVFNVFIPRAL